MGCGHVSSSARALGLGGSDGHHAASQHIRAMDFLLLFSLEETQLIFPLLLLGFTTSRFVLSDFVIIGPVLKTTVSI